MLMFVITFMNFMSNLSVKSFIYIKKNTHIHSDCSNQFWPQGTICVEMLLVCEMKTEVFLYFMINQILWFHANYRAAGASEQWRIVKCVAGVGSYWSGSRGQHIFCLKFTSNVKYNFQLTLNDILSASGVRI